MRTLLPLVLLLVSTTARAQTPVTPAPTKARVANALRVGDAIRIKVWREPDLSGDVTVDDDGNAAIPRIGSVAVTAVTPDSVRRLVTNTYSAWLVHPAIEVKFLRRMRVFGAVRAPGIYPVEDGSTVADVVALAGGVTEGGSYDDVRLARTGGEAPTRVTHVARLADLGVRSGDEIYVPPRGWASRNSGTLVASVITAMAVLAGAAIR